MIDEIKRALEIPEIKAQVMKLIEPEINEVVTKMVAGLPSKDSDISGNLNSVENNSLGVRNDNQQPQTPPPEQPLNFDTGQPVATQPPVTPPPSPQQAQMEQIGKALFNPQVLQSLIPYVAQALGFGAKPSQNSQEEVFEKMKSNYMFFKELEGQNDTSNETLLLVSNITKALTGKNDSPAQVMGATVDQMLASNNRGENES